MSFKINISGHVPDESRADELIEKIEGEARTFLASIERLGAIYVEGRWEYTQGKNRKGGDKIEFKEEKPKASGEAERAAEVSEEETEVEDEEEDLEEDEDTEDNEDNEDTEKEKE